MKRLTINEIADLEIRKLSEDDKKALLEHPDYQEHHFGYGMYLRNEYVHSGRLKEDSMLCLPDDLSEKIFMRIIRKLKTSHDIK